jgi:Domain of unknown function (DUF4296)
MKIHRYSLVFLGWLALLSSCAPQKTEQVIPEGILPADSMTRLLADLHIAESRLLLTGVTPDAVLPKKAYILLVLATHRTDTAVFSRSFDFYTDHPDLFAGIYAGVITEISKQQAEQK